jgi:hypothetical protein
MNKYNCGSCYGLLAEPWICPKNLRMAGTRPGLASGFSRMRLAWVALLELSVCDSSGLEIECMNVTQPTELVCVFTPTGYHCIHLRPCLVIHILQSSNINTSRDLGVSLYFSKGILYFQNSITIPDLLHLLWMALTRNYNSHSPSPDGFSREENDTNQRTKILFVQ